MDENPENQIIYSQQPQEDVPLDGSLLEKVSKNMSFIGIFSIVGAVLIAILTVFLLSVGTGYRYSQGEVGGLLTIAIVFLIIVAVLLFIAGLFLRKSKYAFESFFRTSSLSDFHNGIEMQIKFFSIHIALLIINVVYQLVILI